MDHSPLKVKKKKNSNYYISLLYTHPIHLLCKYQKQNFSEAKLSILSVTRHLICGNNFNWLLNLNLIYETLWTGGITGLFISRLEKLNWFRLTGLITLVLLMWKWMRLFFRKNYFLRCWGWPSLLTWIDAPRLSLLLKLPPRKLVP